MEKQAQPSEPENLTSVRAGNRAAFVALLERRAVKAAYHAAREALRQRFANQFLTDEHATDCAAPVSEES